MLAAVVWARPTWIFYISLSICVPQAGFSCRVLTVLLKGPCLLPRFGRAWCGLFPVSRLQKRCVSCRSRPGETVGRASFENKTQWFSYILLQSPLWCPWCLLGGSWGLPGCILGAPGCLLGVSSWTTFNGWASIQVQYPPWRHLRPLFTSG